MCLIHRLLPLVSLSLLGFLDKASFSRRNYKFRLEVWFLMAVNAFYKLAFNGCHNRNTHFNPDFYFLSPLNFAVIRNGILERNLLDILGHLLISSLYLSVTGNGKDEITVQTDKNALPQGSFDLQLIILPQFCTKLVLYITGRSVVAMRCLVFIINLIYPALSLKNTWNGHTFRAVPEQFYCLFHSPCYTGRRAGLKTWTTCCSARSTKSSELP